MTAKNNNGQIKCN